MPARSKNKRAPASNNGNAALLRADAKARMSLTKLSGASVSHTVAEHVEVDDIDILDRLLAEHMTGGSMSRYPSREAADAVVSGIVLANIDIISTMTPRSNRRSFIERLSDLHLTGVPSKLHGIVRDPLTGAVREYETDCARLVLVGNTDKTSPYPIADISSYPCLLPTADIVPVLTQTTRSLLPEMKRTAYYITANPLLKAYLERCCDLKHTTWSNWNPVSETLTLEMRGPSMPKRARCLITMIDGGDGSPYVTFIVESTMRAYDGQPGKSTSSKIIATEDDWAAIQRRFPQDGKIAFRIYTRANELARQRRKHERGVLVSDVLPLAKPKTKKRGK